MSDDNKCGECERCGEPPIAEDLYIDYERDKNGILTGHKRLDIGYLICPSCFKKYCVDDSFATQRYY